MAEVTIKLGDQVLQTHVFEGDLLRVGRSRENDIVLENLSVSRHHVQIRHHEGQYVLFDMNSSNGTFLNGTRITRTELMSGDQIKVGKHLLTWYDSSEQATVMEPVLEEGGGARVVKKAAEARAEAWVKVENGRLKDREFKIVRFETSIGKGATNDIVLTDDWLLAKKQAIILRRGNDEFLIEDLGGIRRVKVNGKTIDEPVTVRTGDKLDVGGTRLTFYSTAAKYPSAPAQIIVRRAEEQIPAKANPDDGYADGEPDMPGSAGEAAHVLDNDSFDIEELFEPPSGSRPAVVRSEIERPGAELEPAFSVGSNGNGYAGHGSSGDDGVASEVAELRGNSGLFAQSEEDEQDRFVNDKEVQVWKSALNNPSPAIRRQAAKMLKKLTGRKYDV